MENIPYQTDPQCFLAVIEVYVDIKIRGQHGTTCSSNEVYKLRLRVLMESSTLGSMTTVLMSRKIIQECQALSHDNLMVTPKSKCASTSGASYLKFLICLNNQCGSHTLISISSNSYQVGNLVSIKKPESYNFISHSKFNVQKFPYCRCVRLLATSGRYIQYQFLTDEDTCIQDFEHFYTIGRDVDTEQKVSPGKY